MLVVLAVAVGAADIRRDLVNWPRGLLVTATCLIVIGLVNQAWDLWKAFHIVHDLTRAQRNAWRFEVFWRLGMALLFVAQLMIGQLIRRESQAPSSNEFTFIGGDTDYLYLARQNALASALNSAVFLVIVLVTLSTVPRIAGKGTDAPALRNVFSVVVAIVASVCAITVWAYMTLLAYLIHIATIGVLSAQSLELSQDWMAVDMIRQGHSFFQGCVFGAATAIAALIFTHLLASQWTHHGRRVVLVACTTCCVILSVVMAAWSSTQGIRDASPFFAATMVRRPWSIWWMTGAVLLLLATALAYRFVQSSRPKTLVEGGMPTRAQLYFFELRWTAILLAASQIAQLWAYSRAEIMQFTDSWWEGLGAVMGAPEGLLSIAILFLSIRAMFGGLWQPSSSTAFMIRPLPLVKFFVVWAATLLALASGIVSCAWLGFAIWLGPIPRLIWP